MSVIEFFKKISKESMNWIYVLLVIFAAIVVVSAICLIKASGTDYTKLSGVYDLVVVQTLLGLFQALLAAAITYTLSKLGIKEFHIRTVALNNRALALNNQTLLAAAGKSIEFESLDPIEDP